MKPLRIALTKGRLEKDTVSLLESAGYDCTAVREKGRRLILPIGNGEIEVVLAKAADVMSRTTVFMSHLRNMLPRWCALNWIVKG